jgi:hypothetical protein
MLSRGVKPILCLIVLLAWPCLGWGGRAEAGFARGVALASGQTLDPLGGELQPFACGENETRADMAPPKSGKDIPAPAPDGPGHTPTSPRDLLLVLGGSLGGGMSSRGGSSAPPGGGAGLLCLLPFVSHVPGADPSGLMLPEDERLPLPSSASRLFRPPRAV